ncbi:hypothetical protein KAH94_02825 [bacterium]|nr:hypothetical protein [bacterium]
MRKSLNAFEIPNKTITLSGMDKHIKSAKYIKEPFSDFDILDLQDAFLVNGLHYIKVDDAISGRALVNLFLNSLNNYYTNIACLTTSQCNLRNNVTNLYEELMLGGYLQKGAKFELEEFFLEKFYYDFIWVEATDELVNSQWTTNCFRQMKLFKLDQLLPVLVISYKPQKI